MSVTTSATTLLAASPVTIMLPVKNMARARSFYEQKLGLKALGPKPDGKFLYECGGSEADVIALFPKEAGTRADHTALSFQVLDLAPVLQELEERGVVFEDYDLPGLKTVDHVAQVQGEKAAWFKDTEGNILCVHEDLG